MTVLNALTFDTIRRRFKRSKELRGNRYSDAVKDYEKKMRILKKLLAMQAGFSLIAVPPLVVSILFHANAFTCYDASHVYLRLTSSRIWHVSTTSASAASPIRFSAMLFVISTNDFFGVKISKQQNWLHDAIWNVKFIKTCEKVFF
ncbi:unnamed protein product [Clavelina lepadiformis]|uniref:Uncharacterized protein n=1 Tax=Clavelina lepadiformis TaxID=159417 RepID=A0ABP0GIA8_CLALP